MAEITGQVTGVPLEAASRIPGLYAMEKSLQEQGDGTSPYVTATTTRVTANSISSNESGSSSSSSSSSDHDSQNMLDAEALLSLSKSSGASESSISGSSIGTSSVPTSKKNTKRMKEESVLKSEKKPRKKKAGNAEESSSKKKKTTSKKRGKSSVSGDSKKSNKKKRMGNGKAATNTTTNTTLPPIQPGPEAHNVLFKRLLIEQEQHIQAQQQPQQQDPELMQAALLKSFIEQQHAAVTETKQPCPNQVQPPTLSAPQAHTQPIDLQATLLLGLIGQQQSFGAGVLDGVVLQAGTSTATNSQATPQDNIQATILNSIMAGQIVSSGDNNNPQLQPQTLTHQDTTHQTALLMKKLVEQQASNNGGTAAAAAAATSSCPGAVMSQVVVPSQAALPQNLPQSQAPAQDNMQVAHVQRLLEQQAAADRSNLSDTCQVASSSSSSQQPSSARELQMSMLQKLIEQHTSALASNAKERESLTRQLSLLTNHVQQEAHSAVVDNSSSSQLQLPDLLKMASSQPSSLDAQTLSLLLSGGVLNNNNAPAPQNPSVQALVQALSQQSMPTNLFGDTTTEGLLSAAAMLANKPTSIHLQNLTGVLQNCFIPISKPSEGATSLPSVPASTQQAHFYSIPSQGNNSGCRKYIPLSLASDQSSLSEYQCLLREQICLFGANGADLEASAQGRNKPIKLGQVGVLCKHCASLPPGNRGRGAVYFPARLSTLYQAAQNMAINHFGVGCKNIPESTRARLMGLKEKKPFVIARGTKQYWINTASALGLVEAEDGGLLFHSQGNPSNAPP